MAGLDGQWIHVHTRTARALLGPFQEGTHHGLYFESCITRIQDTQLHPPPKEKKIKRRKKKNHHLGNSLLSSISSPPMYMYPRIESTRNPTLPTAVCALLLRTHSSFDDHHDRLVIHATFQWRTDVPGRLDTGVDPRNKGSLKTARQAPLVLGLASCQSTTPQYYNSVSLRSWGMKLVSHGNVQHHLFQRAGFFFSAVALGRPRIDEFPSAFDPLLYRASGFLSAFRPFEIF